VSQLMQMKMFKSGLFGVRFHRCVKRLT
jgi:hypothetical protein